MQNSLYPSLYPPPSVTPHSVPPPSIWRFGGDCCPCEYSKKFPEKILEILKRDIKKNSGKKIRVSYNLCFALYLSRDAHVIL